MTRFNSGLVGTERETSLTVAPGVWTVNEQTLLKGSSLWPRVDEQTDPYIGYVVLLLKMNGANGSTVFTDSSLYNNTVTASGNAQISTAQSKFDGASGVFDGNNDYLQINSSNAFDFPGDFTIECWVRTAGNSANQGVIVRRVLDTYGVGTWGLQIDNGAISFSSLQFGGIGTIFGTVPLGTWTHIAVSRSGSTIRMFLDGALSATVTDSTNFSNSQNVFIGAWGRFGSGSVPTTGWLNGYIDELRITRGIARYTSTFQPRTTPFPTTTSNTGDLYYPSVSLLLHMDGSSGSTAFVDSSSNALAVTANGNAQISTTQSKFNGTSGYYDGNGDYLSIASGAAFDFGQADFTIEFWGYFASAAEMYVYSKRSTGSAYAPFACGVNASAGTLYVVFAGSTTGSSWNINGAFSLGAIAIPLNTWTHLAYVRNGTTITAYVNGVGDLTASSISGPLMTNSASVSIGASSTVPNNVLNGYIDDFRITKGVARYTSSFTPPSAPFPNSL